MTGDFYSDWLTWINVEKPRRHAINIPEMYLSKLN